MKPKLAKIPKALSSLWFTLILFALIVGVLAADRFFGVMVGDSIGAALSLPFGGLFVNLVAAVVMRPRVRQNVGLLIFHLALAAIALLAAGGQFVALHGHVEVTEGTQFDPAAVEAETGFLHPWNFENIVFLQGPIHINYAPGMNRRDTLSTIFFKDTEGEWKTHVLGDDTPLVIEGYRFYTTFNKGFAPILTYQGADGQSHTGSVHLPSYPLQEYNQGNVWTPPDGSDPIQIWLSIEEPVYIEDGAWKFDLPKNPRLVVEAGGQRTELKPGESVALANAKLRFDEVRTWMGYKIFYDPAMAWMLAASIFAAFGLAWHVFIKLRATPWDSQTIAPRYQDAKRAIVATLDMKDNRNVR